MPEISFKISEEDFEFLMLVSKKTGSPISSIYRDNLSSQFKSWKIAYLLSEYAKGSLGFKKMCLLANISLNEGMLLVEKEDIEPAIPSIVDKHTSEVRDKLTPKDVFKGGKIPKRKTPEIKFD